MTEATERRSDEAKKGLWPRMQVDEDATVLRRTAPAQAPGQPRASRPLCFAEPVPISSGSPRRSAALCAPSVASSLRRFVASLLLLSLINPASADPSGDALLSQVVNAYERTNTYEARIRYETRQTRGRWEHIQKTTFRIAFDRAGSRLLLDMPDVLLVVDGPILRLRVARIKERHLEIKTPIPLTYDAVTQILPTSLRPKLVDLRLLLDGNVKIGKTGSQVQAPDPDAADPDKRRMLAIPEEENSMLVRLDENTSLVSAVEFSVKLEPPKDGIASTRVRHQIDFVHHNTPLPDQTFAFDTTTSIPVGTLNALAGPKQLEGQPAPAIKLIQLDGKAFDLSKLKARIVLVGFWATWYPARDQELGALAKIQAWSDSRQLPVAAITVNLKDSEDKVRADVQRQKLELPVLLAHDDVMLESYHARELPRTVVIMDGKVLRVFDTILDKRVAIQSGIEGLMTRARAPNGDEGE